MRHHERASRARFSKERSSIKKLRFPNEQLAGLLKQIEARAAVKEFGRDHGFSDAAFYK